MLTPQEQEELDDAMDNYGHPTQDEKQSIYTYFKKVLAMEKNIKTANLNKDEIGFSQIPVRTDLQIALYCKVMGMDAFAQYFEDEAQIILGTSLSFEGFLNKLAVTQKRESSVSSMRPRQKGGFFGKKDNSPQMQMQEQPLY